MIVILQVFVLGFYYQNGIEIDTDICKAFEFYQKFAKMEIYCWNLTTGAAMNEETKYCYKTRGAGLFTLIILVVNIALFDL